MNSLVGYGSDDDSPEERSMDTHGSAVRNYRKLQPSQQHDDTNYDEVQMSCSEDSDAETKSSSKYNRDRDDGKRGSPKRRDSAKDTAHRDRREDRSERDRNSGRERSDDKSRHRDDDRPKTRDEKDDRNRSRDDDRHRERDDDRHRERDDDRHRDRDDDRHRDRDDDRHRDRDDDRNKDRDRYKDDEKSRDRRDDRRDRYSSRDDRYRQDRDRKRSRSPRDRDRDRRRSRSPRRSRSRSRDITNRGGFQRRFDRGNRMDKNDPKTNQDTQNSDAQNKDRFFMPGITGRFRDQIEKRKLLWQKKETEAAVVPGPVVVPVHNPLAPKATKLWESTTFAQDTDGKVANKFKRLMGIRNQTEIAQTSGNKVTGGEVLKKQDEMFSAMEQQYEVARTTTHTMRGVGLGFSSFNR